MGPGIVTVTSRVVDGTYRFSSTTVRMTGSSAQWHPGIHIATMIKKRLFCTFM
jgi:hypothetical protein